MIRHLTILAVLVLTTTSAAGQEAPVSAVVPAAFTEPAGTAAPVTVEISKDVLTQESAAIDALVDLPPETRTEIKDRLQQAISWLENDSKSKDRQREIESALNNIPNQLSQIKHNLANFSDAEFQAMPTGKSIAELESQLATLREQVTAEEKLFREREAEAENRTATLTTLAKDTAELEQKIANLRPQAEAAVPADPVGRSKSFEIRARLRLRQQELVTAKMERRRLEESGELLPLQRDLAKKVWTQRQKMLTRWQTAIDNWRQQESKRQAAEARRIAENSHSALKSLAEENAQIAEYRAATAAEIQRLSKTIKQLRADEKNLDDDFDELSDRVEHAGATSTTGLLLRKKREELPPASEFARRAEFVQTTMPDAHLLLLQWKRLRRDVADPEDAAADMLPLLNLDPEKVDIDAAAKVLQRLLTDRRDLLDKAIPDQNTYLQDLNELELANKQFGDKVAEFRQYLNQRVLWIRSTDVITLDELRQARRGLQSILSPSRWIETGRVGGGAMLRNPVIGLALLAVMVLLGIFRARLLKTQTRLSATPPPGERAKFLQCFAAFGIAVLLSAQWPALLGAIGYRLKLAGETSSWTEAVGGALITSVYLLWMCELIRELCRRDGVGEKLFGWPAAATSTVRTTLELAVLAGVPLFTLLQLAQFGEIDQMQSLQRVLFVATLAFFGIQLARLTRPRGPLMQSLGEVSASSMAFRSRHAIWLSVTAVPLTFVVLSVTGFHFSAYQLSGHLAQSAAALVAIILLHSLALCWLNVVAYNHRLQTAATESSDGQTTGGTANVVSHPDPENVATMPVVDVDAQFHSAADSEARDLLRYACLLLLVVGGWFTWSEVLPAFRVFDQVVMWESIKPVAESFVDENGKDSIRIVDHSVPTTLTDAMLAMLICFATLLLGKRIPGVLQLAILEHLPMENGGRQAIGIIARYLTTLAGILVVCKVLNLSWSSVQWLAAAMTVGLGFGLQEIFANLVSGLIILVERPIRVGDIVSVGDVTGTVTRMQMRATTVTDYDRRELIVPNKKFITDNVINWTLSDPISRVVLPVGVAYGTDVTMVREILLKIAAQSPHVLDEPPPNTLFKGFGESTLNCQLMVFIPQRSVYIEVVNELNAAIAREFQAAGIQIAFPQLDLHIKRELVRESASLQSPRSAAA